MFLAFLQLRLLGYIARHDVTYYIHFTRILSVLNGSQLERFCILANIVQKLEFLLIIYNLKIYNNLEEDAVSRRGLIPPVLAFRGRPSHFACP